MNIKIIILFISCICSAQQTFSLHRALDNALDKNDFTEVEALVANGLPHLNVAERQGKGFCMDWATPLDKIIGKIDQNNRIDVKSLSFEATFDLLEKQRALLALKAYFINAGAKSTRGNGELGAELQKMINEQVFALACAQDPRLSADSPFSGLPSAITQRVWNLLNGLPIDQPFPINVNGGSK